VPHRTVRYGAVRCGTVPTVWTLLAHPWMPARPLAIRARQAWKGRRDWGAASAKTSLSPAAASLARRDWQWLPLRHGQGWRAPTPTAGQLQAGGGGCSSSARLGGGAPWSLGSSVGDHQAPTSEPAGTTMVVQTARLSGWELARDGRPGPGPGRQGTTRAGGGSRLMIGARSVVCCSASKTPRVLNVDSRLTGSLDDKAAGRASRISQAGGRFIFEVPW